ncbi:hypothetical protein HDU67_007382 [Dinochytrium kinnereticum]|nr:hypothetical protein HDU67_007382 [Dinochytrium kinnereticum]
MKHDGKDYYQTPDGMMGLSVKLEDIWYYDAVKLSDGIDAPDWMGLRRRRFYWAGAGVNGAKAVCRAVAGRSPLPIGWCEFD